MTSRSARSRTLVTLLLLVAALLSGLSARAQPVSIHLTLGNPSGATADVNQPANYLIVRDQYALSYARDRGIPNWVSWHLQASDLGAVDRYSGNFITDTSLPAGWYRVTHNDYTNSGYDRGHMTPSADRTATVADNESTFILTNVLPQAPENNQGLWAQLEEYARTLVGQGNEIYVISGGAGSKGNLAGGKLTIPASVWKVMLVLPAADTDDAARVTAQTQVIAVWTPNSAATQGKAWADYTTTVNCIQQRTGYDFFAAVEDTVEATIEGAACPAADNMLYLPLLSSGTTQVPPTPTPGNITITFIDYAPAGSPTDEYVLLKNSGGSVVDMTGWTLRDLANNTFSFPGFTLASGAEVRVWTKAGTNDAGNLYWGRSSPVWNNTGGDTAILRDVGGTEIARYSY